MEEFCKDDDEIAKVLSELDKIPSEPDDDISETEDNVEVECEYHSDASADDTEKYPDDRPSDYEKNRLASFCDVDEEEENADTFRICSAIIECSSLPLDNQGNTSALPLSHNQIDPHVEPMDVEIPNYTITDLNKPSTSSSSTNNSSLAFCYDQSKNIENSTLKGPSTIISDGLGTNITLESSVRLEDEIIDTFLPIPEVNQVDHSENDSLANQTILTMNFESDEDDPPYQPSSGESSSDDISDVEINDEEVIDLDRQTSKVTCRDKSGNFVTVPSLSRHKNIVLPKKRNMRG